MCRLFMCAGACACVYPCLITGSQTSDVGKCSFLSPSYQSFFPEVLKSLHAPFGPECTYMYMSAAVCLWGLSVRLCVFCFSSTLWGVSSHQGAQISLILVKFPPHSHGDMSPILSTTGKAGRGGWTPRARWPATLLGEFQASDTLSQNKTKHGGITQSGSVPPYVCLHTYT